MAIICMPPLIELLRNAEKKKGSVLTRQEVETIRDNALFISVPDRIVQSLDPSRGYSDISPQRCWEQWSQYRTFSQADGT